MSPRSRAKSPSRIRSLGIVVKKHPTRAARILRALQRRLERSGIEYRLDLQTAAIIRGGPEGLEREALAERSDAIIVIGGDGTLLSVARSIGSNATPLLGVNLGSLGFLTELTLDDLHPAISAILDGKHAIQPRMRLRAEIIRNGRIRERHDLLNDIVVNKSALARILDINVTVNGQFMTTYKADGLIVSTPTGSTAYSLSAGGPIIDPSMEAVILCPICPHTLTNRPVVLPGGSRIDVGLVNNHGDVYVTIDGQVGAPFLQGDRILVRRSRHPLFMIQLAGSDYFDVLRRKLKWSGRVPGAVGRSVKE
jgi:NAD+ kinase